MSSIPILDTTMSLLLTGNYLNNSVIVVNSAWLICLFFSSFHLELCLFQMILAITGHTWVAAHHRYYRLYPFSAIHLAVIRLKCYEFLLSIWFLLVPEHGCTCFIFPQIRTILYNCYHITSSDCILVNLLLSIVWSSHSLHTWFPITSIHTYMQLALN